MGFFHTFKPNPLVLKIGYFGVNDNIVRSGLRTMVGGVKSWKHDSKLLIICRLCVAFWKENVC